MRHVVVLIFFFAQIHTLNNVLYARKSNVTFRDLSEVSSGVNSMRAGLTDKAEAACTRWHRRSIVRFTLFSICVSLLSLHLLHSLLAFCVGVVRFYTP